MDGVLLELLRSAVERQASDLFVISGSPLMMKVQGQLTPYEEKPLTPVDTEELLRAIYRMAAERDMTTFLQTGDDDFSFSVSGLGRFRCNAYYQRGSMASVLRVMSFDLPDAGQMHIPQTVLDLADLRKGMVLITGSAGSGKSTTLACLIDQINNTRFDHIITIEDPIEYLHSHRKSIVSQREVSSDTQGYKQALRAALRESPDVILLGEMRDFETIQTAITAAETGQLVLATLHTVGAAKTVDRVIDVFPPAQQQQIRIQLSMVLQAVVSQQLVPTIDGTLLPAFEVMKVNSAARNLIREGKSHQLDNLIYGGGDEGMMAMDGELLRLFHEGRITKETAIQYSSNPDVLEKRLV
jgi:twitching motility protein PilT